MNNNSARCVSIIKKIIFLEEVLMPIVRYLVYEQLLNFVAASIKFFWLLLENVFVSM